jgi:hypothetical protein
VVSRFFCGVDGCSSTVLVGGAGIIDGDVAVDVGLSWGFNRCLGGRGGSR